MTNTSLKGKTFPEKIILFLAFGFGFGWIRPAPGTWGTIPGLLIAAALMFQPWLHVSVAIVVSLVGIWICQRASEILGEHDFGGIVIDEIAGILITLLWFEPTLLTLGLGFIWFRVFDIIKPWPIRWIDKKISGGFGIMFDDVIAGVFAWVALYGSLHIIAMF